MIYLYTGKTGSGKAYQLIKDVFQHWLTGRDIYSNTKLFYEDFGGLAGVDIESRPEYFTNWEKAVEIIRRKWLSDARKIVLPYIYRVINRFTRDRRVEKKTPDGVRYLQRIKRFNYEHKTYTPKRRGNITYFDDITELIEIKDGIIIMDEAQNLLDARNWESLPLEFSNKLRQHRKHNLDLYATTQNMGTIDINMRRLVQRWSHCKDIFALFWLRNPSLLTLHSREFKDIDSLYNKVDDLIVPTIRTNYFIIHLLKKRLYDTLYDIGFNAYKILWLEKNKQKTALIIPKNWTLNSARTQSLLMKFYLDQIRSNHSKTT